jgi:hypothetical protein
MTKRAINGVEIRFIGMSRSGNHAVINWILKQASGRICFLNCTEGKTNPFASCRPMDDGERVITNIEGFELEAELRGEHAPKDVLVFSHEDNFLRNACSDELEREHDGWLGASRRRVDLLLVRDPFNLFASRYRANAGTVSIQIAKKIWKQHAREALARRPRKLRHEPTVVLYNRWVREPDYRRELAEWLELAFTDAGIHDVQACEGGSSFDGLRYDGRAGEMKVLERWRQLADEPAYRDIFDAEMVAMADQLFGRVDRGELIPR